ncbi:MAG: flagellar biosynthesis anti-sigma factor FlgM [Oscillospiraceae bacterium]|nr:flagellar biosynthesis anti-sigma factor FlgM [Oscillospiraceae bacterium]
MDIKFNSIQPVGTVKQYQNTQRAAKVASYAGVQQASDKVDFSDSGKLFAQAMKRAMNTPEVRESKVAALRDSIQDGSYSPSSKDIARKMLSSLGI